MSYEVCIGVPCFNTVLGVPRHIYQSCSATFPEILAFSRQSTWTATAELTHKRAISGDGGPEETHASTHGAVWIFVSDHHFRPVKGPSSTHRLSPFFQKYLHPTDPGP